MWAEGSRQFSCFNPDLGITNSWDWLSLTRVSDRPYWFRVFNCPQIFLWNKLLFLDQKWRWQWWWWWWRGRILVWRFEMRNLIWPPSLAGGDSRGGAPALDNGGIHSLHRLRHRPIIEQLGWTTDLWAAALPTFAGWQKVKWGNRVPSFGN